MKKSNIKCVLTLGAITSITCSFYARKTSKKNKNEPVSFEASYIADNVNNITGGIKTGSFYLGMANMMLGFDTEMAKRWNSGRFYMNAANTHGGRPSKYFIGDVQVVSNISAGNHTYLQEIWVKQHMGETEIRAGLKDLNVEFANSEYGELYLNNSFGILPIIYNNFNASIFPLTNLGFTLKWSVNKETNWIYALYAGSPTNFDYNPYNLKWQFNSGDGILVISELQKSKKINRLPGVYKIGVYSHFHIRWNIPDSLINRLIGIYTYADQTFWERKNKSAGMFVQLGYSPLVASTNNVYIGSGVNFSGLLSKKAKDIFGLAFAHVVFTHNGNSETSIELTDQYRLTRHIFIQSDFQYIVYPSGTGEPLPNALAANFRFGFNIKK
jgi:porin